MHAEELAGLPPAVAEARQDFHRGALDDVHFLVHAVGKVDELLLWVFRKSDVPRRATTQGSGRDDQLPHERAIRSKHLNPVVRPVADVHEPVVRRLGAVDGIAELLRGLVAGVIETDVGVVRLVAVGSPIPLQLAGVHVDDGDALVAVSIGDVRFVGVRVEGDLGHSAEVLGIVAAPARAGTTDLHQERPIPGEFQDVGVITAVAADPQVIHVVHGDPVVRRRPVVTVTGATPRADEVALLIELEDVRRRNAALTRGRIRHRTDLRDLVERVLPMNDPDVVLGIDRHADDPAEDPVVRQRLRPQRIHLEHRHTVSRILCSASTACKHHCECQ